METFTTQIEKVGFDLEEFKRQALFILEDFNNKVNEEDADQTIGGLQKIWNDYAEKKCVAFYKYFMILVESNDTKYYKFVPVATTIANFERLLDVLTNNSWHATLRELSQRMPERYFDLSSMITHLKAQLLNLDY
jgi:hypothetical protein